jgi:hypothetical protein
MPVGLDRLRKTGGAGEMRCADLPGTFTPSSMEDDPWDGPYYVSPHIQKITTAGNILENGAALRVLP